MIFGEQGMIFSCVGEDLVGVLALPEVPCDVGVVILVGGPQYRVGSHRQFVLLARRLAAQGYPVLRFDCRGMGDGSGRASDFQAVGPDVAAAITALKIHAPSVRRIVLWGLCDAASAALLYCHEQSDAQPDGLCLLNPWVRSEASYARTQVRHYYAKRLCQREFWAKILGGRFQIGQSVKGLFQVLGRMRAVKQESVKTFQTKMLEGLLSFRGGVLLILSGRDLTAREFDEYLLANGVWSQLNARPRVSRLDVPEADHTFSSCRWRLEVEEATLSFLRGMESKCAVS